MSIPRPPDPPESGDPPVGSGTPSLTDPTPAAGTVRLGARRTDVLHELRAAGGPLTAARVAELTGLHLNTARFHLDGLVEQRLAERSTESLGTRGRPRVLYAARVDDPPHSYRLLSRMLAGLVATLDPDSEAAGRAGRQWGRSLAEPHTAEGGDTLDRLEALMATVGFDPEVRRGREPQVRMRHCPFIDAVDLDQPVVCAMHRGLIEGALAGLGSDADGVSLRPFEEPSVCVARLSAG